MTAGFWLSRRQALQGAAALLAAPLFAPAQAGAAQIHDGVEAHGLSVFGDLKYAADFPHFDYVNPAAPIGGTFSHTPSTRMLNQAFQTFNSLNTWILRGDAALQMELTFTSLMTPATDEPSSAYGLAARSVRLDRATRTLTFRLREGLTFHDGSAITAEDLVWTFTTLKAEGHPMLAAGLRGIDGAQAPDPLTIVYRLNAEATRETPQVVAGLPILSRAYYSTRPFNQTSSEAPLGSGPFRVGRFESGRFIEYDRVADWWGWRLPTMRGQMNWGRVRVDYFRDRAVGFEAFKAGQFIFREEFTSRDWATGYDFPAMRDGRVKREEIPDNSPSGAQGYFLNMRRPKFADPRVREAIGLCFDYEWTNRNIFFGLYDRNNSFFENSDMVARGRPGPEELALLEPFRGQVPDAVFGEAVMAPVSDGTGSDRAALRRASELFRAAGITTQNQRANLPGGERFSIEFIETEASFERITLPFVENLRRLGIDANIRRVDAAQYQNRLKDFDFDVATQRFGFGVTPGESLRRLFSSRDADTPGSNNLSGIKSPAVDALIERAIAAATREDLTIACRALDRVLRAMRPWVPHWYKGTHWLAYWDVFDRPAVKPRFSRGVFETWWIDQAKAARLGRGT